MTAPSRQVLSIDAYLHQVDLACADLPEPVRRRIVTDLNTHLRELPDTDDPLTALGSPIDYARDLRAAMGLPESRSPQVAPRRSLMPWAVVLGALGALAVLAIVLGLLFRGSGSTSAPVSSASPAPTVSVHVVVPTVVPALRGKTVAQAIVIARRHGLRIIRVDVVRSGRRRGIVLAQLPAPGRRVPARTEITLQVSGAR